MIDPQTLNRMIGAGTLICPSDEKKHAQCTYRYHTGEINDQTNIKKNQDNNIQFNAQIMSYFDLKLSKNTSSSHFLKNSNYSIEMK